MLILLRVTALIGVLFSMLPLSLSQQQIPIPLRDVWPSSIENVSINKIFSQRLSATSTRLYTHDPLTPDRLTPMLTLSHEVTDNLIVANISPDKKWLVYSLFERQGREVLFIYNIKNENHKQLHRGLLYPRVGLVLARAAWSPNSKQLVFYQNNPGGNDSAIYIYHVERDKAPRRLAWGTSIDLLGWIDDTSVLNVGSAKDGFVEQINSETRVRRRQATLLSENIWYNGASWSPNKQYVLLPGKYDICQLIDLHTGRVELLPSGCPHEVVWSIDNASLLRMPQFTSQRDGALFSSVQVNALTAGTTVRVLPTTAQGEYYYFDISKDMQYLYYQKDGMLYIYGIQEDKLWEVSFIHPFS